MDIKIEKVGNKIQLQSAWRADIPKKCKKVPGGRWNPSKKVWQYPLDWSTCTELRKVFGDELKVGIELSAWAREAKAEFDALKELVTSDTAELVAVAENAPRIAAAVFDYQKVGIKFLATSKRMILGDDPGLGKTLQTFGAVIEAQVGGPILVLAPSVAATVTWPNELQKWLPSEPYFVLVGNRKQRQAILDAVDEYVLANPGKRVWVLGNTEMVRMRDEESHVCKEVLHSPGNKIRYCAYRNIMRQEWATVVLDESHRAAIAPSAKVAKQSMIRQGLGALKLIDDGLFLALSGTPFRGKVERLWGTLNLIRPELYTSYWNWVKKWFNVYDDGYGLVIGALKQDLLQDFYDSLAPVLLRRTKREVVQQLPAKRYAGMRLVPDGPIGVWLDMTEPQAKAYKQMVKNSTVNLPGGTLAGMGLLSEDTRLRQLAGAYGKMVDDEFVPTLPSNKFDWCLEFFQELGIVPSEGDRDITDNKVVIASQFTKLINLFAESFRGLGVHCHVLTGETSAFDRECIVERFQAEGGPRVFLLNTNAGGVSITLDAADDLIFLDETYIPDDQTQVEDRIHRVSRMHNVTVHYLRSRGTIEEEIAETTDSRDTVQREVLDGRRGVDSRKLTLED